jgi:dihydrofolate reductase
MARLIAFNNVTLDGYFAGTDGDISWTNKRSQDAEWSAYVAGNASSGGVLVLGRITYQMMARYWSTPQATADNPVVAERMNSLAKVVFSRSLDTVSWSNSRLIRAGLVGEIRGMKDGPGPDMAILGSGSIVAQLAQAGLIDEYQLVVNPVAIGRGRTLFEGVSRRLDLRLASSRAFGNGNVVLCYVPAA